MLLVVAHLEAQDGEAEELGARRARRGGRYGGVERLRGDAQDPGAAGLDALLIHGRAGGPVDLDLPDAVLILEERHAGIGGVRQGEQALLRRAHLAGELGPRARDGRAGLLHGPALGVAAEHELRPRVERDPLGGREPPAADVRAVRAAEVADPPARPVPEQDGVLAGGAAVPEAHGAVARSADPRARRERHANAVGFMLQDRHGYSARWRRRPHQRRRRRGPHERSRGTPPEAGG